MVHATVVSNVRYQHPTIVTARSPVVDEFMRGAVHEDSRVLLASGAASLAEYALLDPNIVSLRMVADDDEYRAHLRRTVDLFTDPVAMRGRVRNTKKPRKMREDRWHTQVSDLLHRIGEVTAIRSTTLPVIYPSFEMVDPEDYDLALLASEQRPSQALERFELLGRSIPTAMLYHVSNGLDVDGVPLVNAPNFSSVRAEPVPAAPSVRLEQDVFTQLMGSYTAE